MKIITATVISTKPQKSAVVVVETSWKHPLYQKSVKRSKKFLVDNPSDAIVGDQVEIQETRPTSARKHFKIIRIVKKP